MAVLTAFASGLGSLLAVIGEVAPAILTAFLASFGGLFSIVGKVTWIAVSHFGISCIA